MYLMTSMHWFVLALYAFVSEYLGQKRTSAKLSILQLEVSMVISFCRYHKSCHQIHNSWKHPWSIADKLSKWMHDLPNESTITLVVCVSVMVKSLGGGRVRSLVKHSDWIVATTDWNPWLIAAGTIQRMPMASGLSDNAWTPRNSKEVKRTVYGHCLGQS